MKRILWVLLSVCILLCAVACGKAPAQPTTLEAEPTRDPRQPTESQSTTETTGIQADPIRLLALEKSLYSYFEWVDDFDQALVRSEHSCITLGQEDAEAFPEMAEVLRQKAAMQENAMLDEYDDQVSLAREELASNRDSFETKVSTLDVRVRRADSLVISLLTDSYSHYGHRYSYRGQESCSWAAYQPR